MIRTGQMLLFQALQRHALSPGFNFENLKKSGSEEDCTNYLSLLKL